MTKLTLKRIGVMSLAKIYTIMMAVVGLIMGLYIAIMEAVFPITQTGMGEPMGTGLGWINIIIVPIIYALIGFVSGVLGAWLYNLIAKWIGGVELEFKK